MAWYNDASDEDLDQSLELAVKIAQDARSRGDKGRENAAHETLDGMISEAQKRGWGKRK